MVMERDNIPMVALILIPLVALFALAIYLYGADSRIDEVARRRGFNV
jgi:hypothetical protein